MSEFPSPGEWSGISPEEAGFDADGLAQAVQAAIEAETDWPTDLSNGLGADSTSGSEPPPYNEVLGPTMDRGPAGGVLIRRGKVAARWGDPARVEMTFSVAKSYLAILAGLAVKDGLIGSIDDPVRDYCRDGDFDSEQNRAITWRHLLHQTSEWQGELWSKPDWIDHNRQVGSGKDNSRKGIPRELQPPGSFYEYNDVRVNRLSLCLLQVFRRALPDVLRERIMQPIGATDTWQWHAYRNAWFEIDGERLPSVPGGSHWGGGIFINAWDHARVGWLIANGGNWNGQQLLDESWIEFMRMPSPCFKSYGALWWLNTEGEQYPSAPATSFFAMGAGNHLIWVDQSLELTGVFRWIKGADADRVIGRFMAALND